MSDEINFLGDDVCRIWFHGEWWFAVEDVIKTLIDCGEPYEYLQNMLINDPEFNNWSKYNTQILNFDPFCSQLKMRSANLEGVFRIIQSLHTAKSESFKLWMAKLAKIRIDELGR